MVEEKKENVVPSEKAAEAAPVKAERAPAKPEPAAPASAPDAGAAAKPAPAAPEVKKEKPSNCAACNKSIKKKRWYYRDGKFFCTKRCWQSKVKKESSAAESTAAENK